MWRDVDNEASAVHTCIQVLPVGMSSRTLWRIKIIKKKKSFLKCLLWLKDKLIWSGEKASCSDEVYAGFLESMILEVKGHHSHIPQICFKLRGVYDLEFNRGTPNIIKKKILWITQPQNLEQPCFLWITAFSLRRNATTNGTMKAMSRSTEQVFTSLIFRPGFKCLSISYLHQSENVGGIKQLLPLIERGEHHNLFLRLLNS